MEHEALLQESERYPDSNISYNEGPSFEFVTISGPSEIKAAETSKRIRIHAMKNYVRKQHQQAVIGDEKVSIDQTHTSPSLYKGKFKLDSWTHKAKTKSLLQQKVKALASEQMIDTTNTPAPIIQDQEILRPRKLRQPSSPPVVISTSKVDPFDSLVISLQPRSEQLLVRYHTAYRTNSIAVNPEGDFFYHASADSAMLHAILYLVALHRDVEYGIQDSVECLYHGGETFRIINERLADSPGGSDDATIAAVSMLANRENLSGKYDVAKMHILGLMRLVNIRGGINSLKGLIQRMVAWSDLCFATIWGIQPLLPFATDLSDISTYVVKDSDLFDPQMLFGIVSSINDIIYCLRNLSATLEFSNLPRLDRIAVSNLIYTTEYRLLLLNKDDTRNIAFVTDISSSLKEAQKGIGLPKQGLVDGRF
ncbi:hypothetical protein B7463_g8899, partial [Scytalidium lignicola]